MSLRDLWVPFALVSLVLLIAILKPRDFALSNFDHLSMTEVLAELSLKLKENENNTEDSRPYCPPLPEYRYSIWDEINQNYSSWSDEDFDTEERNIASYFELQPGGSWEPKWCNPVHHVSIIVPYRNRPSQLKKFLLYMHPFLQLQLIRYKIFIISQVDDQPFNRGKLLNIGFVEAVKQGWSHCFIFHDVDLLPENLSNIYGCTNKPKHMSSSINTFRYTLQYRELFGGAISIIQKQFRKVNGFSNKFFGWGGEDDDFYRRLRSKSIKIVRLSPAVSSYQMLPHKKEAASTARFDTLNSGNMYGACVKDFKGIYNVQTNIFVRDSTTPFEMNRQQYPNPTFNKFIHKLRQEQHKWESVTVVRINEGIKEE